MNASPEIRAVTKLVLFILTVMVAAAAGIYGTMIIGAGNMMIVLGIALMLLCFKIFYDIQVSEERYKDKLRELQSTIRGE
jgi:fatty acid desaturase